MQHLLYNVDDDHSISITQWNGGWQVREVKGEPVSIVHFTDKDEAIRRFTDMVRERPPALFNKRHRSTIQQVRTP